MAIALIITASAVSQTSGTSLGFTGFGSTLPAGTLITIGVTTNGSATSTGADNSTQAGTANSYTARPRLATGTACIQTIWCVTTRPILASDTVTVTLSASTTRRAARFYAWSGVNAAPLDKTATAGTAASPLTVGPTTALAVSGELAINLVGWFGGAVNSGAADTTGFTLAFANSGGVTSRVELVAAYALGVGTAAQTDSMTFTSLTNARGEILTFKPLGGTLFSQSISGAAQFSGIRPVVALQRKHPGVLAFAGSEVAHPTGRRVTAGFAPTGALARQLSLLRTLTGALSFSGASTPATARVRSLVGAVFAPVGSQTRVKAVSKSVSGALSFVGAQAHVTGKALVAAFAPTGVLARALTLFRTLTGGFAPSGSLKRFTSRKLLAAQSWVGMVITSEPATHFTAVFRPTAANVTHGLPARTLFAGLTFTTSMARFTTRRLVASLIASGVMHTQYIPPAPVPLPGGGGYGALMADQHFSRYRVTGAWQRVKRVKA